MPSSITSRSQNVCVCVCAMSVEERSTERRVSEEIGDELTSVSVLRNDKHSYSFLNGANELKPSSFVE